MLNQKIQHHNNSLLRVHYPFKSQITCPKINETSSYPPITKKFNFAKRVNVTLNNYIYKGCYLGLTDEPRHAIYVDEIENKNHEFSFGNIQFFNDNLNIQEDETSLDNYVDTLNDILIAHNKEIGTTEIIKADEQASHETRAKKHGWYEELSSYNYYDRSQKLRKTYPNTSNGRKKVFLFNKQYSKDQIINKDDGYIFLDEDGIIIEGGRAATKRKCHTKNKTTKRRRHTKNKTTLSLRKKK